MVTAELAVAILAAFSLVVMFCWGIYLVVCQLRIVDTAGAVARQEARGDRSAAARARADAPQGAVVAVRRQGQSVTVTVTLVARPLARDLVAVPLRAEATVVAEPGSGAGR